MNKNRWNERCARCGNIMHNRGKTWLDDTRICPSCWYQLVSLLKRVQNAADAMPDRDGGTFQAIKEKKLFVFDRNRRNRETT